MTDEGWIRAERAHEREMADINSKDAWRRREALTTRIGYIATAFAIVGVTAIVALLAFKWQDSAGQRGKELEQTCIAEGGTWTNVGGSTSKMCVRISEVNP